MFLISDDYGDFKKIMTYEELKELYFDEVIRDIKENREDKEIFDNCLEHIEKLLKNKSNYINTEDIASWLSGFGWYVQDLRTLQRDINNLREFLCCKDINKYAYYIKSTDDMLELLDGGLKNE